MLTLVPQAAIEDSEVASILLSVTPQFGPISAVTRGRTWSLDLGTLTLLCFAPCVGARDCLYVHIKLYCRNFSSACAFPLRVASMHTFAAWAELGVPLCLGLLREAATL